MPAEDRDTLTGLYTRKYALGVFERLLAINRDAHGPIAVILADIDRMYDYNVAYGLSQGDELIQRVASAIVDVIGEGGLTCRYAGDEFLMILPGFPAEAAALKAEEIQQAVQRLVCPGITEGKEPNCLRMTLGVAAFPNNGHTMESVITAADLALCRGKDAGRGRLEVA